MAYLETGGYAPLPSPEILRIAAERAALDGRGGAGFPTARKLTTVALAEGPRVVVANGEEGEPTSVKDRWLLVHRPHLVLDGLRVAWQAVDADELYVYVSDGQATESITAAIAELDHLPAWTAPLPQLVRVDPGYVAGEETAVVRGIDGFAPKPTLKPPRPYEVGVGGHPTLVANVESLARLALTVHPAVGTDAGVTLLATVSDAHGAGLYELPAETRLGDLIAVHREPGAPEPLAVLMGGFAGGIWPPSILHSTLDRARLREDGVILGCAAVVVVEPDDCVVAAACDVCSYLAGSSSGQCGICVRGTAVVAENLTALAHSTATPELVTTLRTRVTAMRGRGNCAMPDAVEVMVRTLLDNFPDQIEAHLSGPCEVCRQRVPDRPATTTRFRIGLPSAVHNSLSMAAPSKV